MSIRRISRLLIANRGEIARRIQRTAHDMGISTVAVYSDDDRDAAFVREADVAVALHGRTAADTYLDIEKLLRAAQITCADAVHPGYGFLSENSDFARACAAADLTFVGPSAEVLHSMGLKDVAKSIARDAGVPVLPDAVLGDDESTWRGAAEDVGLPLLVKATAGGGGKGMRMIAEMSELPVAVAAAQREAANSFGNSSVFLEKFLATARHIEVQVFGDEHGGAVHLFERECSVQRRHQKVIEESPAPNLPVELRKRMTDVSVDLVRALGYVGAGTVEYLVDDSGPDGPAFYFLEMNTRLQVEHGVTEAVTGVDLVRWQLDVAAGHPLPLTQDAIGQTGHAIEARVCAEDPADDYRPTSGPVHCYRTSPMAGVRYDDAFVQSGAVPPFFDSMVAKIIGTAARRDEAIGRLARALRALHIHGVTTNRDHLLSILDDAPFRDGKVWTGYLDARTDLASRTVIDRHVHLAAMIATRAFRLSRSAEHGDVTPGWRAVRDAPAAELTWRDVRSGAEVLTRYRWQRFAAFGNTSVLDLEIEGTTREFEIGSTDDGVWLVAAGVRHDCRVAGYPDGSWWIDSAGTTSEWTEVPRLPEPEPGGDVLGSVVEVPGTVVHIAVAPGEAVVPGQRLLVIEAMKMEYPVAADRAGVVEHVAVAVGDFLPTNSVPVILKEATA